MLALSAHINCVSMLGQSVPALALRCQTTELITLCIACLANPAVQRQTAVTA